MAQQKTIAIRINADGSVALVELNKVEKKVAKQGGVLDGLKKHWLGVTAAVVGAYTIMKKFTDSAFLAARVETLGIVVKTVGANAGYAADELDKYVAGVKSMGITTQQADLVVIKMAQAQLDLAQSTDLARVAQDAAVIGNINSSEAVERMIHGITTLNPLILRRLGILIDLESEYKKAAAAQNRNAASLTSMERQQIAFNATLEQGQKIAGTYEAAMGTVGKQLTSLPRYIEEVKLKFGELFRPALGALVRELTVFLKDLDSQLADMEEQGTIGAWADAFVGAIYSIEAEVLRLSMLLDKVGGTLSSVAIILTGGFSERIMQINLDLEARYIENEKKLLALAQRQNDYEEQKKKTAAIEVRPRVSPTIAASAKDAAKAEALMRELENRFALIGKTADEAAILRMAQRHATEMEKLRKFTDDKTKLARAEVIQAQEVADLKTQIAERQRQDEERINQMRWRSAQMTAQNYAVAFKIMSEQGGKHARKWFSIYKIAAAGETVISTANAAMAALTPTQGLGPIAGWGLAAAIIAKGAASLVAINNQKFSGGGGGLSGGGATGTYPANPATGLPETAGPQALNLTLVIDGVATNRTIEAGVNDMAAFLVANNGNTENGYHIDIGRSS